MWCLIVFVLVHSHVRTEGGRGDYGERVCVSVCVYTCVHSCACVRGVRTLVGSTRLECRGGSLVTLDRPNSDDGR